MLLSQDVKTARVSDAVAAGQTDVTSDAVDSRDFETVEFVALLGAITAGGSGTLKVQGSDESASGFTDLSGASVTYADTDSDGVLMVEVSQPIKRYLRAVIERDGADAVVDGVIALQGNGAILPVEQPATSKLVLAPA
ncbi:hypothetical protein [Saccharospirillum sp.]|uniref:hypothetical protein n=1 Tax=Saccharospirillum sp. TaxID=2033801 RepID=UPI0034A042B4